MTLNQNDQTAWVGHTLVDNEGGKIGKIVDIYADQATGQPEWIAVNTGRFGTNIHFVPLVGAVAKGDDLQVTYTGKEVTAAPDATSEGHLTQDDEARLYRHYGMEYSTDLSASGLPVVPSGTAGTDSGRVGNRNGFIAGSGGTTERDDGGIRGLRSVDDDADMTTGTMSGGVGGTTADMAGRDVDSSQDTLDGSTVDGTRGMDGLGGTMDTTGGAALDRDQALDADAFMTRSEEELQVATESYEAGRVRLRKFVVTEHETRTVPVSHEEVRIEREPITDGRLADTADGFGISEGEQEIVLHEERPVVTKQIVAKERVRLRTEMVVEDRQVEEDVRKERIEVDDDAGRLQH